jgi:hypothetical protein
MNAPREVTVIAYAFLTLMEMAACVLFHAPDVLVPRK